MAPTTAQNEPPGRLRGDDFKSLEMRFTALVLLLYTLLASNGTRYGTD